MRVILIAGYIDVDSVLKGNYVSGWQHCAAVKLGLYTAQDPTYGRYLLSPHPPELALHKTPNLNIHYRRVFLHPSAPYDSTEIEFSEEIHLTPDELTKERIRGGRWIYSKTLELSEPFDKEVGWEEDGKGRGVDVVLVHGLNDYGGRYSPHCLQFLKAGFRLILPDLPNYGRSTGIHSYLPTTAVLPAALHAVMSDVVATDVKAGKTQRKVFLSGASMGGWTVLYYALKYPPTSSTSTLVQEGQPHGSQPTSSDDEPYRPHVAGAFVMCPMVEVSPESRPSAVIEMLGRAIVSFAGALPLAASIRGKVSDDPRVEEDFFSDPLCYHGLLRVGTGLALLQGMLDLAEHVEQISIPIRIIHGDHDRATSHKGSIRLFDKLASQDKEIEIYEGYEHVMNKVGIDAKDDEKRQRVLKDWRAWLIARC